MERSICFVRTTFKATPDALLFLLMIFVSYLQSSLEAFPEVAPFLLGVAQNGGVATKTDFTTFHFGRANTLVKKLPKLCARGGGKG